jgi:hypothetical protein
MVCPECGHSQFTQTRLAQVEQTVEFLDDSLNIVEVCETITGYDDASETVVCQDCFTEHDPVDLITEDDYNENTEDLDW